MVVVEVVLVVEVMVLVVSEASLARKLAPVAR